VVRNSDRAVGCVLSTIEGDAVRFEEYAEHDGLGLAALVRDGEVTARELLDVARARAEQVNPKINAIVRRMDDEGEAHAAGPLSGPYAGVPFLLKDLGQEYAGIPSSWGSRALAEVPATEHATVTQRWLDAGLVPFGRTNVPEFGAKGVTEPELFGPCRNPWDLERTTGGSSGGSSAAVAAGIVPVAGASDGGGSIRIPAACCGVFGVKPSRGLVPFGPQFAEPLQGAAVDGVVSRSVRDTAAMLDVLMGGEAVSPYLPALPDGPLLDEVGLPPGRLRIGMQTTSAVREHADPEAVRAVEDAAALLIELGHDVEPVDRVTDDRALSRDFLTTWFTYGAHLLDEVRRDTGAGRKSFELDSLLVAALGRAFRGTDYVGAVERRHDHVRALARFFEGYDLLLTPTLAEPPVKIGALATPRHLEIGARVLLRLRATRILHRLGVVDDIVDENLSWVPFTQLANITGRPAMSVPLYWTAGGLPLGAQFVGPLGSEGLLLRLAAQLEEARPWAQRRATL
jgi:Asp-tRNA(Asn)/Glu-tRNA(Gln) amidotransferase A subunit family amidase